MSLQHVIFWSYLNANVSVSSIINNGQFYLKYYFPFTEIPSQRYSAKSQLLRLYSQYSFNKILKALHTGLNIYIILEESSKALLKMFFETS